MSDLVIALITIFGTVASVSGVIAYVFNGTRKLIREMHLATKDVHTTLQQMHREAQQMHREAEQRHREVVELLKKGFGEVLGKAG